MEINYVEKLREELCKELFNNPQKVGKKPLMKYLNEFVLSKIKELNNSWRHLKFAPVKDNFIEKGFISLISRENWVGGIHTLKKEDKDLVNLSGIDEVTTFLFSQVNPYGKKQDFFSVVLGYNGFLHFMRVKDEELKKVKNQEQKLPNEKRNPLEEKDSILKNFFKYPAYLYVYDEGLRKAEKKRPRKKDRFYPVINTLFLDYISRDEGFTLRNIEGRDDHTLGNPKWCKEHPKGKNDSNAFDISFRNSRSKLILRIHVPYKKREDEEKFDLLLGAFLWCQKKGYIAAGNVIIKRNKKKIEMSKGLTYDYKLGNQHPNNKKPHPDVAILRYLVDRRRNWMKIPYDKDNFNEFAKWLNDYRNTENHTMQEIIENDFLITYPSNAFESINERTNFIGSIKKTFADIEKLIEKDNGLDSEERRLIVNYLKCKEAQKKILMFPSADKIREHYSTINRDFFRVLNQSLNIIFIIPKIKNPNQISSIYTTIGYAVALERRVIVLFEEGVEKPTLISESEPEIDLYVSNYKHLYEIPKKIVLTAFNRDRTWQEAVNKYLDIHC